MLGDGHELIPREESAHDESGVSIEEAALEGGEFPIHAITQRPMHMYHSWGSQNAWLRQIHAHNYLFVSPRVGAQHGFDDGDWIWVISHNGRIKVQAAVMDGVNKDTVWTWNAIGKRSGAWNLDADAGEARKGFLLNHLISELLPEKGDGYRYSNSDPLTGQAAWFDLRVRIEKAKPGDEKVTLPQFDPTGKPPSMRRPEPVLRYGRTFRGDREGGAT